MRILSLDLSKYKTVACYYEAETGRHQFMTVLTTHKALHDLIVDRETRVTSNRRVNQSTRTHLLTRPRFIEGFMLSRAPRAFLWTSCECVK